MLRSPQTVKHPALSRTLIAAPRWRTWRFHPGQLVVTVASGTLGYTILGEGQSMRAGAGTPTAAEVIAPDTEATFGPGEWFVYEAGTVHMDRNPGNEPAVVLLTGLVAADQPFLIPVDMAMATPAA